MRNRRCNAVVSMALLASVLIATVVASSAQAVPPTRESEPPSNFDSSLFCGFPLRVESLRKNVKTTTFSDGRQLTTGSETRRLTNLSVRQIAGYHRRRQSETESRADDGDVPREDASVSVPRRTIRAGCLVVHRSAECHLRRTGWLPLLGPRCHREPGRPLRAALSE